MRLEICACSLLFSLLESKVFCLILKFFLKLGVSNEFYYYLCVLNSDSKGGLCCFLRLILLIVLILCSDGKI